MRATPQMMTNIGRFNSSVLVVCGDDQHSTPHTNKFHQQPVSRLSKLKILCGQTQLESKQTQQTALYIHRWPSKLVLHLRGPSHLMPFGYHRPHGYVCCASILTRLASWLAIVLFHMTVHRVRAWLSTLFPPHNRISERKCWTCLVFTISNCYGPGCLSST